MADDSYYMPPEQSSESVLQQLWNARPWQGYAQNPPSMMPQIGMALGLLHPRLGGATRDMGMAGRLAGQGDAPPAMQGMPEMPAYAKGAPDLGFRAGQREALMSSPSNYNAPAGAARPGYAGTASQARDQHAAYVQSLAARGIPESDWPTIQQFLGMIR